MPVATFTPEEVEKVRELHSQGYTWEQISVIIGRPESTIYQNIGCGLRGLNQKQRQKVKQLRRQGIDWPVIAEMFGIDETLLRNRIRRRKVAPPPNYIQKRKELTARKKSSMIVHNTVIDPGALAERERRYALINQQLETERLMGDPPLAYSALARVTPERLKVIKGG